MHNTFVTGYSIQGFGVPETSMSLFTRQADVSVDITEASIAHAGALITRKLSVHVGIKDDPPPNMRRNAALGSVNADVRVEMEGDFHYYLHLAADVPVRVTLSKLNVNMLRLLTGCMSFDLEPRPVKTVLDNNHTAYDVIGGAGTCHYGDTKC